MTERRGDGIHFSSVQAPSSVPSWVGRSSRELNVGSRGMLTSASLVVSVVVPMLLHPGEMLAAAAWFGMVTWLMARTRNIWDCVLAHAVTNALIAAHVLATGAWSLWA